MSASPEPSKTEVKYKLIDSDTHLTEPHDLWVSRAPKKFLDRVPQVKEQDGIRSWVIDGDKIIGLGATPASAVLKKGGKARNFEEFRKLTLEDVHPGSSRMKERLEYMDEQAVWAQIVYPNILGFAGHNTAEVDFELRLMTIQIYNDAMAELQDASGGRICPMALLPWWDAKDSANETRRIMDLGLKGININPTPYSHCGKDGQQLPDLADPYWDSLWDICDATRLPINFHIGSSDLSVDWVSSHGWPGLSVDLRWAVGGSMLFFDNARTLSNILVSGLIDRYKNLQFVSVESGIGWIPYMLEVLDYQYAETAGSRGLKRLPSEYFATNLYGCFWFEQRNICTSIRNLGIDNCMFMSDFPHPTCLYPIDDIEARLADFTEKERYKVIFGNCAELYSISLPGN